MKTTSIIFADLDDINAAACSWALAKGGAKALWAKDGSYAAAMINQHSLHIGNEHDLQLSGALADATLRSVWFRRARAAEHFANSRACDQKFLQNQWRALRANLDQLAPQLRNTLWVNAPEAARRGENKLFQLQQARKVGLLIPDTLVSNDPAEIKNFLSKYDQVIYKTFAPHIWENPISGTSFVAHAKILSRDRAIDPRSLALCPGIFQQFIDKRTDLRVTVIGAQMFVMQLQSKQGQAYVDWRSHAEEANFSASAAQLSDATKQRLRALMQAMGLVYGCVDLVVDQQQNIYFLEVNQSGQFLFAERWVPEFPLLRAMAALLATGRPDYNLQDLPALSYQEFLASEAHQQWRAECAASAPTAVSELPFLSVEAA